MTPGKFITIEGIEGAGKSTLIKFIQRYLMSKGKEVVVTREPGGTPLAENIRQLLLNPHTDESLDYKTELLLMFACRSQHIAQCIAPALSKGQWVVCDRFTDATYAYQGGGRGIDTRWIAQLEQWVVEQWRPQLTILLDIDPRLGLARSMHRGPQDRFEKETVEFFARVRQAYLDRAAQDKARFRVVDASQTLSQVEAMMVAILEE